MISNYILMVSIVMNLQVKFLEKKQPSIKVGLRVGLLQKVLVFTKVMNKWKLYLQSLISVKK